MLGAGGATIAIVLGMFGEGGGQPGRTWVPTPAQIAARLEGYELLAQDRTRKSVPFGPGPNYLLGPFQRYRPRVSGSGVGLA